MKKVALAEIKDQLSKYLHDAAEEEILITRHGRPAGILIGFGSEDEWFDYKLENDPRFLSRVEAARSSLRSGTGSRLEELATLKAVKPNKRMQRTASKGADRSRRGHKGGR